MTGWGSSMGGRWSPEARLINQVRGRLTSGKDAVSNELVLPNRGGDHSAGVVQKTPAKELDIANKAYVDAQAHDAVTLAGTPDYLTISGQVITRGTIDIGDDTNLVAGTNITLSGDTLNVDDAFLINSGNDTTSGVVTAAGFLVTGDASSADTAYVPMILYNTDATPPAASGFPIGTLYIQYTA